MLHISNDVRVFLQVIRRKPENLEKSARIGSAKEDKL